MDRGKNVLTPCWILACGVLLVGSGNAVGQDVSHLPADKAAVVLELRKQYPSNMSCATADIPTAQRAGYIEDELLSNLEPIQIGRNLVFSKSLYGHAVGTGSSLDHRQFEAWRNRLDHVYDAFTDFLGTNPRKIYFDAPPIDKFPDPSARTSIGNRVTSIRYETGHFHGGTGIICLNIHHPRAPSEWRMIRTLNSTGYTAIHEIAHIFEYQQMWSVDAETFAELLLAYAMEKTGIQYANFRTTVFRGDMHRKNRYNESYGAFLRNNLPVFSARSEDPSAFRLYVFGLVDRVGWDTYRKVFHSYAGVQIPWRDRAVQRVERARDFFDRIEYFSGRPGVLRSLPDKGRLLDEHFNVNIEHKPYLD